MAFIDHNVLYSNVALFRLLVLYSFLDSVADVEYFLSNTTIKSPFGVGPLVKCKNSPTGLRNAMINVLHMHKPSGQHGNERLHESLF